MEGTSITLGCVVVGKPEPTITWYKEEVEITTSKRFVSTYKDGRCTLIINNITVEEEAEFTCKATNEAGSCTTFVDIFVEQPEPQVTEDGLESLIVPNVLPREELAPMLIYQEEDKEEVTVTKPVEAPKPVKPKPTKVLKEKDIVTEEVITSKVVKKEEVEIKSGVESLIIPNVLPREELAPMLIYQDEDREEATVTKPVEVPKQKPIKPKP